MPLYVHRTTKQVLPSTSPAALTEPEANYIKDPDLSAVAGFSSIYWIITGDIVSLMTQAERDAVDAAQLTANRDSTAAQLDQLEGVFRAFALALLDELNRHSSRVTAILDAIDGANNLAGVKTAIAAIPDLPQRTVAQLKAAIRNKLGS